MKTLKKKGRVYNCVDQKYANKIMPFYIGKIVKNGVVSPENHFSQKVKISSRPTDVMIKPKMSFEIKFFCGLTCTFGLKS